MALRPRLRRLNEMRGTTFSSGRAAVAGVAVLLFACTGGSTANSAGGPAGSSSGAGGGDDGGTNGSSSGDAPAAGALPATTFLYVSEVDADRDVLMAFDTTRGAARMLSASDTNRGAPPARSRPRRTENRFPVPRSMTATSVTARLSWTECR